MKYKVLIQELNLSCTINILKNKLYQKSYYRCTAYQKPYLIVAQVIGRFLWAIAHIFWTVEWLKVLWSDEMTFLIRGRITKEKVIRMRGERTCLTCIQYQLHRGHTTPVHAWGAIRYRYKSPLIFVNSSSKNGAFIQTDYLA
jgi:hypothetical protein